MRGIQHVLPPHDVNRGLTCRDLAESVFGPSPTIAQLASVTRAARRLIVLELAGSAYTPDGVEVFFRSADPEGVDERSDKSPRDGIPIADKSGRRAATGVVGRG